MTWYLALLISVVLGGLVFFVVRKKDKDLIQSKWNWVSPLLRGLMVTCLLLILISPIFNIEKNYEEQPRLAILIDKSTSVSNAVQDTAVFRKQIDQFKNTLESKYDVALYSIGDGLHHDSIWNRNYSITDIQNGLYQFQNESKSNPVQQVVLISDGIYNMGADPSEQFNTTSYKINTLVIGDTVKPVDAAVKNVLVNKIVPLDANFECLIDISAYQLLNKHISVQVNGTGGVTLHTSNHVIKSNDDLISIPLTLKATTPGLQKYSVVISPVEQEKNLQNNVYDFYIEVVDEKIKVLLVASAPHPDVATIQAAVKDLSQYELVVSKSVNSNDLQNYHVFIAMNPDPQLTKVLIDAKKSTWFVLGAPTLPSVYQLLGISIIGRTPLDVLPVLNTTFSLFQTPDELATIVNKLPPLHGYMSAVQDVNNAVLFQKIGNVATTNSMWFFKNYGTYKQAFLTGEGLWKWGMYEYKWTQKKNALQQLIRQTIQQVHQQQHDKPLNIYTNKVQYNVYEPITIYGMYKNENGVVVNDPKLAIQIVPPIDKSIEELDRVGNSYKGMLGILPEGAYQVTGTIEQSGKRYQATTRFEVMSFDLESVRTHADYALMHRLAQNSGGLTYLWGQADELAQSILSGPESATIIKVKKQQTHLIDWKWCLVFLFILFFTDWLFRKYNNI